MHTQTQNIIRIERPDMPGETWVVTLDELRSGQRELFQQLVDAYSPMIYNLARRITHDDSLAEDVTQETFVSAYRALPHFEARASLRTWLYRIATNAALMRLRAQAGAPVTTSLDTSSAPGGEEGEVPFELGSCADSPERRLMQSELNQELDAAIATLSEPLRLVFVLRDVEELSTAETAEVLGLSETAVKSRLHRARLSLRERLAPYLDGLRMERI